MPYSTAEGLSGLTQDFIDLHHGVGTYARHQREDYHTDDDNLFCTGRIKRSRTGSFFRCTGDASRNYVDRGCGWTGDTAEIRVGDHHALSESGVLSSHAPGKWHRYTCRVCHEQANLDGFAKCLMSHWSQISGSGKVRRAYGEDVVERWY